MSEFFKTWHFYRIMYIFVYVKVDWTNWLPGEPNDAGSNEECVQIVGAAQMFPGGWNDNNCNQAADFICEKAAGLFMFIHAFSIGLWLFCYK